MNELLPVMLVKSITLAGVNATVRPGVLQLWVDEIEKRVDEQGKFSKSAVAYFPLSPPPLVWDYKCKKCRFWEEPDGCSVVEGKISPRGWCAIWLPPEGKPALSWVAEFIK